MASINKGSTKGAGKSIEQIVDKIGEKISKEISDNLLEKIPSVISKDLLVDINADAEVKGDLEQQIEKKIRENIPKTMTEKTTVVVDPIVKFKSEKGIDLTQFIKLDKDQLNKKIKDLYKLAEQGNETASKQLVSALQVADKIGLKIDVKDKKNYKDYVDYYKDIVKEVNTVLNQIDLSSITSQIDEVSDQIEKNVKKTTDNTKKQLTSIKKEVENVSEESSQSLAKLSDSFGNYYKKKDGEQLKEFWSEIKNKIDQGDQSLKQTLKDIGLITDATEELSVINTGMKKSGGLIGDNITVLATKENKKETQYEDTLVLKEKLDEAAKSGINVARILDVIRDKNKRFFLEIQETAQGEVLGDLYMQTSDTGFVNPEIYEATDEEIQKLIKDVIELQKLGVQTNDSASNYIYKKGKGFTLIDLGLSKDDMSPEEIIDEIRIGLVSALEEYYEIIEDPKGLELAHKFAERFDKAVSVVSQSLNQTPKIGVDSSKKKAEGDAEKARKEAEQEAERKRLEEEERRKAEEEAEKAKREAEEERKRKEEEERRIEEQRTAEAKRKEEEAKAESGTSTGQTEVQKTKEETDAIYKKAESIEELYNQIRILRNINNDIALYEDPNSYIDSGAGKSFSAFDKKKTGSGYEDLKILKKELLELSPILNEIADVTERMSKKDVAKMFGHYFGIELPFATEKATDIKGIIDAYHEVVNVNKKLTEIKPDSHLAQTLQNYKKQIIELNPVLETVSDHIEEIVTPKQWQDKLGDYFKQEQAEAEKTSTITINEFNKIIKKVNLTTASFEELLKYFEMLQKTEFNPQVDKQVNIYRNIGNSLTEAFKNLGYEFDNVSKQWVKIEQQANNKPIVKDTQQATTQVDTLGQELAETGQQGQIAGERIAEGMREAREEVEQLGNSFQNAEDIWEDWDDIPNTTQVEESKSNGLLSRISALNQNKANVETIPARYIQGYVRSLEDIKKQLELEGVPKSQLNKKAKEIRQAEIDAISELSDGFVRVIHRTRVDILDSIVKNGLGIKGNSIEGTASLISGKKIDPNYDYGTHYGNGSFVVADIPSDLYRAFEERGIQEDKLGELKEQYDLECEILSVSQRIEEIYDDDSALEEKNQLFAKLLPLAQKYNDIVGNGGNDSLSLLLYGDIKGGSNNHFKYNSIDKLQNILKLDKIPVLSDNPADDIGLSYDELIKKVELENEEIAKGNREFKERLTILDAQGKVIASHWGKEKSVNPFTQEELEEAYKKGGVSLFHTHPMDGFFSANDISSFAGEEFNEFILDALGSITKIDFSNLEGPIKKKTGELLSSIVRSIYEPFKENETGFKHFIDDEAREKSSGIIYEVLKAISNKLKISIDDSESTFKDYGNLLSDVEKSIINHIVESLNNLDDDPFNIKDFQIKDIIQENLRGYDYKDKNAIIVEQTDDIDILINRFKELRDQTDRSFEKTCELYAIYEKLGGTDILPMKTYLLDEVTDEQLENMRKALEITQSSTASPINEQLDETQKELRETTQVNEQATQEVIDQNRREINSYEDLKLAIQELEDIYTLSSPILSEEQLQKELAKVRETIDKEKEIIKELEDELSQEVPKAIQRKNEEFDREVEKVREVVNKEKAILEELKTYLDTTIPEGIDVKSNKFNEEVGKVKQAIDEEIGYLDRFRSELEKPVSIDIQKKEEDTFDDSYAFSEAMDRFAKKQQAQYQRKLDNLSALTSQLKAKNDARDEEKELQGVKELDNALKEVIEKINLKIASFSHEEDRVKEISHNEAISLQEIIDKLERIKTLATEMKSAFQGIKVDGKIDIKGIKDILQFEGKDFTTVANSLKSLFDVLNKLKLGDKTFIKQLDSILAKGKELDNLVKVLKTSEKKITQAKENVKSDQEKAKEASYKKELDLMKQRLALEKEYKLLGAKGDSKAEETRAKNLVKINQLEKERKQIVDSRKKGETSKELRDQMNAEIKAIKERDKADIDAEKQATKVRIWNKTEKEFYDEKAKKAKEAADAEAKAVKEAEKEKEKARAEAEKKASQEAKNAERIRKESLEESYGMQKALMKEASDLAIRNLALSDSESEFDIKEVANNNKRIAEIGKQINDIVEKRNKLDSDSITLHRELLNYQEELNRDYQTQFDLRDRNKATEHNENAIAAYKELIKTANEYYNLQINTLGKDDSNPDVIRLNELIDKWEEARKAKEEYNDFSVNKEGSNKSIQGLKEVEEQFANVEAQVSAKIRESLVKELPKYIKLDKENKYIDEFSDKVKEVLTLIKDIDNKGLDLSNPEDVQRVHQIREDIAFINSEKGLSKYKAASETRIKQLQLQIRQFQNNNSAMGKTFSEQFDNLFDQFSAAKSIAEVDELKGKFASLEAEVVKAGKTGKNFFKTFVEHLKSTNAQLLATYFSFQDIIRYGRSAFETIRTLDTALVDLKKTTQMNNTDLEEFYINSSKIAKETGVTTQEIISQAAAWSRLGFSSKEAAETMAELSSQFAKISPGTSVEDATDYLVSTMKAFHIDVADVESEIMDSINRIGNTMATSNSEVGEMLKRSSAAMAEANNTLAETIALESAAVQITRNAETTGTAFRTISMRIRGYDEETEELSEDLENISGDIADLTKTASKPGGISLFSDSAKTTYKSTYELLKEISLIYHDLTDKQQAELLEKLAGGEKKPHCPKI